ncbi:MAG: cellulase family glycosylhydrolase [Acidobacteriaceae bacterium]|nr:cellulase family glycosylhydrolase [Acidobacteriaceae bacterium]
MPPVNGFVETQSDQLVLGDEPFHIAGANIYYFAFSTEADQTRLLDLAEDFGLNVLRIWAFNDFINVPPNPPVPGDSEVCFQFLNPGAAAPELRDGPSGLGRLDSAINLAGDRGIRLILTLTNYHADYGGMPQYQRWLGLPNLNNFYSDARAKTAFQNWVQAMLTRQNALTNISYADDPTILAWEIANEPRCPSDPSGTQTVTDWLAEMSAFMRPLVPRQLIAAGDEGFFNHQTAGDDWLFNGSVGVSTEDILGIPDIDLGTFHLYPDQWGKSEQTQAFGEMWIQTHIDAASRASKPVVLEEYGVPATASRNDIYESWLGLIEQENAAGDLVWMLGLPTQGDAYLLSSVADAPALSDHARRYATASDSDSAESN